MTRSCTTSVIPVLLLITFALSTRHSCFAEQSLRRDEGDREKSAFTSPGRDIPVPRTPNSTGNSSVDGNQPKTTTDTQTKPVYGEENAPSVVPPVSVVTGDKGIRNRVVGDGMHKPDISSAAASDIAFTDIPQAGNNTINTTENTHNTTVSNATATGSSLNTTTTTTSTATISTTTTTTTTTSNTISTTSTSTTTASNNQCPEKCKCPDYDNLSQLLVPVLRGLLGSAGANYTDNVLKHLLHQQFLSNAEPISSILSRINIALNQDPSHSKLTVLLEAARFGVTICWLNSNDTFFLDAAVEARLFPQVRFKQAAEKAQAADKARANSDGSTRASSAEVPLDGRAEETYEGSRLYNISFFCDKGGKVVITRETSLYRYGRWRHANCEVATEGVLTTNGTLPLFELSVIGGDAAWLQNITTSMHKDDFRPNGSPHPSWNSSSGGDAAAGRRWNSSPGDVNTEIGKVFPNVHDVTFSNTSLSLQELSDILSWFQNATDLILRNNSLGDFNCSQLLPFPAAWHDLIITRNGLKSVPACTLRASLVYLQLYKNDISDISPLQYPRLVPAPGLELLDLSDNNISDVGILADMNLTMLVLSGNRISSLHKLSFNRLPELSILELSRNRLLELDPGSFKSLVYLQELRLDHNHLQRFDSSVSPMRAPVNLRCKIFLGSNRFSHPPFRADGYDPGSYIVVYAADNPYACDCDMVGFVNATAGSYSSVNSSSSYADRASFRCRYPASLAGFPVERVASADDRCPVVADCPGGCTCTLSRSDSVVTVDCSGVEHFHQPSVLPATHPLRLEFQGNGTAQAQAMSLQDRAYLLRVVSLNVSGRGLTRVPEFMCEASPRAVLLDLSFNNLTRLPRCLQTRPARENWPTLELRLAHNPWSCDCDAVDMRSWLAEMMGGGVRGGVRVPDAREAWCSPDTRPGVRVAEWDTSECEEPDYLPWVVTLSVILGLALVLGPLLYVYRLKAVVAIHAQFHVRPFERAPHFKEEDHDYEALVVHGPSDVGLAWVAGSLIPRARDTRHRLCVPDRDFVPGASAAESYATAVTRSKATVCLLSLDSVHDDWWLYAFQLARAKNARCPRAKLLLVLLEQVEEADLPEEVRAFLKTNTYLSVDDKWFWKKLFYYLPDPPKDVV